MFGTLQMTWCLKRFWMTKQTLVIERAHLRRALNEYLPDTNIFFLKLVRICHSASIPDHCALFSKSFLPEGMTHPEGQGQPYGMLDMPAKLCLRYTFAGISWKNQINWKKTAKIFGGEKKRLYLCTRFWEGNILKPQKSVFIERIFIQTSSTRAAEDIILKEARMCDFWELFSAGKRYEPSIRRLRVRISFRGASGGGAKRQSIRVRERRFSFFWRGKPSRYYTTKSLILAQDER